MVVHKKGRLLPRDPSQPPLPLFQSEVDANLTIEKVGEPTQQPLILTSHKAVVPGPFINSLQTLLNRFRKLQEERDDMAAYARRR